MIRRHRIVPILCMGAALLLATTATSFARSNDPSPRRLFLDPRTGLSVAPRAAALPARDTRLGAQSAQVVTPVGLPAGAVQLDSTYYDLQNFGSLGHRIEVGSDGRVHVTWQDDFCELGGGCPPNLAAPQPYPNRGMAYAVRDAAGHWTNLGRLLDPSVPNCTGSRDLLGGFGALTIAPSGKVAVSHHLNYDGTGLRGHFELQDAIAGSSFSAYLSPPPGGSDYLFPQIAASTNGSFTLLGEVVTGGSYDTGVADIAVSWLPAPGTKFTCFNWQLSAWTGVFPLALFRKQHPAYPCMAAGSDGRVGVAVTDYGGNVYLAESSDGSFRAGTVRIRNLTNYSDASITASDSTSAQYRPYINCSLAYADTTPNVVWSELQARKSGSTINYFDWRSRIKQWSSVTGVRTVYQVPAGVADRYDDAIDLGLSGPIAGLNTISVDWPQVGFSVDGSETYVAFLRFTDAQVDPTADAGLPGIVTGVGFGDISCSVSRAGSAFSAPQNLTNTANADERFFSLATRNPGGKVRLIFQASATNQAGCVIYGDRGTTPVNLVRRIAYLETPLAASVLAVPAGASSSLHTLRVSPNPAFASARIRFAAAPWSLARTLEVTDVLGRRVTSLDLPSQATGAEWNGHDGAGRAAPAGVYFVHVREEPAGTAVRFVLAH